MKISARAQYGMRAMAELAKNSSNKPLQILELADRTNISNKYLEQIFALLKTAGMIRSIRGPRGGYVLTKPPAEIKMSEIFRALEGSIFCPIDPGSKTDAFTDNICSIVNKAVLFVLDAHTLGECVKC